MNLRTGGDYLVKSNENEPMIDPPPIKTQTLPQDARAMQGVWLFLLTLAVFFLSSILLFLFYVAVRVSSESGQRPDPFFLPRSFVPSTMLLIGVSGALEWALRSARKDQTNDVRIATLASLIMGLLFMVIQSEGMYRLLLSTWAAQASRNSAYALTLVLAFVHAMHVLGGIVGLCITTVQASRERYDHERHFGLRFCTLYWHFLDIVWVLLMACFIITTILVNGTFSNVQP